MKLRWNKYNGPKLLAADALVELVRSFEEEWQDEEYDEDIEKYLRYTHRRARDDTEAEQSRYDS